MAAGHSWTMTLSPSSPSCSRARCQISSVMKGMKGCSVRSAISSTLSRVWRVAFCSFAVPFCKAGLDSSRYQSQYSFQTNSYSAWAARSMR